MRDASRKVWIIGVGDSIGDVIGMSSGLVAHYRFWMPQYISGNDHPAQLSD